MTRNNANEAAFYITRWFGRRPPYGGAGTYGIWQDDRWRDVDTSALVADVVETWITHGKGRPTLCFAVDRAHAMHLQQKFIASGITAEYIDAYTDAIVRRAIAERFHNGGVEIVRNVGCLTTGIDWDVRCIILARPTKSEMLSCSNDRSRFANC
jgi:superfamily II DNA or RNA helicase